MPRQDICNEIICYAWMGSAASSSINEAPLLQALGASFARMDGSMLRSACIRDEASQNLQVLMCEPT